MVESSNSISSLATVAKIVQSQGLQIKTQKISGFTYQIVAKGVDMFNCKDCCFAKIEDGHQERCLADKYKYLQNDTHIKTADGIFTYDRLCLYKRKSDWEKDKSDEQRIKLAREQLYPNIGICLDDDSDEPDDLENLLNQLIDVDYPKKGLVLLFIQILIEVALEFPS